MSRSKPANRKPKRVLTHEEVLALLSEQARKGSISATVALERALRARARQGGSRAGKEQLVGATRA
jgi:hypothetical protein